MKKQTHHLFIQSIIFCLILILTYLIIAQQLHWAPFSRPTLSLVQLNSQLQSESTSSDNNATKPSSNQSLNNNSDTQKTPTQNEGPSPNQSAQITGYISNKTVNRETQILTIRVVINQFLQQAGGCKLILAQGNQNFTTRVMTIDNPSSATCHGFDVPLAKLAAGKWSIKIEIQSNNKQGIIEGGDIEI